MLKTISETKQVIYGMLVSSTGAHLLDSGSAYGRHWERNQSRSIEDFEAEPEAWIDPKYGDVTKSLFHYLDHHLTYTAELSEAFDKFAVDYPEEGYLEIIELWLDSLEVPTEGDFYSDARWGFNTYNFEYWMPSQVVQGSFFGLNGSDYLILQIHNGCDVRGGYTAPKVFELKPYEERAEFILNGESAYFGCSSVACSNRLSVDANGYEIFIEGEEFDSRELLQDPKLAAQCPCSSPWIA